MSWNTEDNKQERGKIDQMFVSLTEEWEVKQFVDTYLTRRGGALTDANRNIIIKHMKSYPGKAPIKRDDLNAHLDNIITVKPA
ncbi:hypothetical protein [Pseudomonas indica]|uniref:Uncharacterized protein n=1 Tax=Pseudomonas indica TaxID=137658 RepID=A0A1G8V3H9_9PSED|nr:hypothetical protein [Pseudomonas indica]SDJ59720.1 hypothetical protein SAMN05216186_10261 [Pseudomonas indica]